MYGEKYNIEFKSISNVLNRIKIDELDFTGTPVDLQPGAEIPKLSKDQEGHFMGSELVFYVEANSVDGMPEFYTENPRKFRVTHYQDGNVVFQGYLVPEQYSDPYIYHPFDIKLKAVDGLGLLKKADFDLNYFQKESDILDHILKKTGFDLPIYIAIDIRHDCQGVSSDPAMEYTSVNVNQLYTNEGEAPSCYEVIEKILESYGKELFITQYREKWLIFRKIDILGKFYVYVDGTYLSNDTLFSIKEFGNDKNLFPVGSLRRDINKRLHHVNLSTDLGRANNILPENIFEKEVCPDNSRQYRSKNWVAHGTLSSQCNVSRTFMDSKSVYVRFDPQSNPDFDQYLYYNLYNIDQNSQNWLFQFSMQMSTGYLSSREVEIPFDIKIKPNTETGSVYYLRNDGWSTTFDPDKVLRLKFKISMVPDKQAVIPIESADVSIPGIPVDCNLVFRFFRNQESKTDYYTDIRVFDMNFGLNEDDLEVPAFINYDMPITDNPINKEKIENIIGSAPDYANKETLFKKVKYDESAEIAPVNWQHKDDTSQYSLSEIVLHEIASNNRQPRQILSGVITGSAIDTLMIFRDYTVADQPLFFAKQVTYNLHQEEVSGKFEEYLYFEKVATIIDQAVISENFSSNNSDPITSSKIGEGSRLKSINWDDIAGKPRAFPPSRHSHGDEEMFLFDGKISINDDGDILFGAKSIFNADVHINGNIYQNGQAYETHAEQLYTTKDFIIQRDGATTAIAAGEIAGSKILKADGTNNVIFGTTNDAVARIGWEGDALQAIATRQDNPTNNGHAVWSDADNMFLTRSAAFDSDKLGGHAAADYPRRYINETISGLYDFENGIKALSVESGLIKTEAGDNNHITIETFAGENTSGDIYLHTDSSGDYYQGVVDINTDLEVLKSIRVGDNLKSQSAFVGGFAGQNWLLDGSTNHLTLDRLTVRGRMDVYELVINKIRATNGSLWVSDSAKVVSVSEDDTYYYLNFDDDDGNSSQPFWENDIIKAQQFTGRNVRVVEGRISSITTKLKSDQVALIKSTTTGTPQAGDEFVRMGNYTDTDRQGAVYLTSSDNNAPYLDVIDGVSSVNYTGSDKVKARLGKLDGITDTDFGGTLSGYGLYSENVYLKGKIVVTGGNAETQSGAQSKADTAEGNAISEAESKDNTLIGNYSLGSLDSLAYKNTVEKAELGTTVIQGGYLRTDLIEAGTIVAEKLAFTPTDSDNIIGTINTSTEGLEINADISVNSFPTVSDVGCRLLVRFDNSGIEATGNSPLQTEREPDYYEGVAGMSADFRNTNQYFRMHYRYELGYSGNYLIYSLWFKAAKNSTNRALVTQKLSGSSLYRGLLITSSNQIRMVGRDSSDGYQSVGSSSSDWNENEWTHVIGRQHSDRIELWINGNKIGETNMGSTASFDRDIDVGLRYNDAYPFDGFIDELRIYQYSRMESSVTSDLAKFYKSLYLYPAGNAGGKISANQVRTGELLSQNWENGKGTRFDLNAGLLEMKNNAGDTIFKFDSGDQTAKIAGFEFDEDSLFSDTVSLGSGSLALQDSATLYFYKNNQINYIAPGSDIFYGNNSHGLKMVSMPSSYTPTSQNERAQISLIDTSIDQYDEQRLIYLNGLIITAGQRFINLTSNTIQANQIADYNVIYTTDSQLYLPSLSTNDKSDSGYVAKGKEITIINKSGTNLLIQNVESGNFSISNNTSTKVIVGDDRKFYKIT